MDTLRCFQRDDVINSVLSRIDLYFHDLFVLVAPPLPPPAFLAHRWVAARCEFAIFGELRREKLAFGGEKVAFGLALVWCHARRVMSTGVLRQPNC
jgi:hypothetical protein